uniref:Ig-like domain-containing protein n=1 Tax=Shimia sediminis TaxID=2497945 RepID=UPI0013DFA836
DNAAPSFVTAVRQNPTAEDTSADTLTFRVTFSEAVASVSVGDFAISGTTAVATSSSVINSSTYDIGVSGGDLAGFNGTVGISLSGSSDISDAAGNLVSNATASTTNQTYAIDNAAPTVGITGVPASPNGPFTATFTFSEAVTGFVQSDIALTNATASAFNPVSTTQYTALITPTTDGAISVGVNAGVADDAAGNGNTAATTQNGTADLTAPTLQSFSRQTPGSVNTNADVLVFRATFNETVQNVGVADFAASGTTGTVSAVSAVSGSVYDVTVSGGDLASLSGTVGLNLAPGQDIQDAAGNALPNSEPATDHTYSVDNAAPSFVTAVRQNPTAEDTSADTLTFRVTFSEAVASLGLGDFAISGTTAVATSGTLINSSTYDIVVTGGDLAGFNGTVGISLSGTHSAADAAGNLVSNTTASTTNETYSLDNIAPGVTAVLRQSPTTLLTNSDTLTWRVVFDEDVQGVDATDFVVGATTATLAVTPISASSYDVTASGGDLAGLNGTVVLSFAGGHTIEDLASNALTNTAPSGANENSFELDNDLPTVAITDVPALTNVAFTATFTFSETVSGFASGDIALTNATASAFSSVSASVYTALITPSSDGVFSVGVAANAAADPSGNGNVAATTQNGTADFSGADVTLTGTPAFPGTPYPITITFTEPVTGLELSDFTTTNVSLANLAGGPTVYTVDATATDFAHSVQLAAGTVIDDATNPNTISNLFENTPDGTAPTLAITGVPGVFDPGDVFGVTFTFSEEVIGFAQGDIGVTNASLSGFAGGPTVFTATVTPDGTGNVTVSVADGAANDVSGDPTAAASVTASIDSARVATEHITKFFEMRNQALIQNQPDVLGFLTGDPRPRINSSVSRGTANIDLHSGGMLPFWIAATGSISENDDYELSYGLLSVGAHTKLGEDLIAGVMFQYDVASQSSDGGVDIDGEGWLIGPYIATRIGDQPLFFDARALFGETSNDITPLGTFTDSFSSDRYLIMANLTGEYEVDKTTRLIPSLSLTHAHDDLQPYVDGLGNPVAALSVSTTDFSLGLGIEKDVMVDVGELTLTGGISATWSELNGSGGATAFLQETSGGRARIDAGLRYGLSDSLVFDIEAFLDGIGSFNDTYVYGLELALRFDF